MLCGFIVFTLLGLVKSQGCSVINVSCADIKTNNGFKFPYNCFQPSQDRSTGHWVEISDNEIKIAHGPPFKHSHQVTNMTDNSITTTECRGLHERCTVIGDKVKEHCRDYVITENMSLKSPDPSPAPNPTDPPPGEPLVKKPPWVGWLIAGIIVIVVIVGITIVILCRRKKKVKKLCKNLPVCLRLRTSQAERETAKETGEQLSAADQQARDDNHQNGKLEGVYTHSIDRAPGGETPPSSGLDRTLRIQESKKIRDVHSGRACGDRGPEDENGGQPLLQNQRAASPDMTGGAVLVNELGFGTQQVIWSSTAPPDADVESTPNMKNTMTDE